ncbi:ABC transporter permease [Natrialbaceae archaeon A-arb3/5]
MNVLTIAKKDFHDAIRSRGLIGATIVFAIFTSGMGALAAVFEQLEAESGDGVPELVIVLQSPAYLLVPVIALLLSYSAISREREHGSLRFLLGLPFTRREVLLGKVLGRTVVLSVAIVIGFTIGIGTFYALTGTAPVAGYLGFTLVTILFGCVYVSIGVGLSALVRSTTRAAVGAVGILVLLGVFWDSFGGLLLYAATRSSVPEAIPSWYSLYEVFEPSVAYGIALGVVLDNQPTADELASGGFSVVAEPWFGFIVLACWTITTLAVAAWWFDRRELA